MTYELARSSDCHRSHPALGFVEEAFQAAGIAGDLDLDADFIVSGSTLGNISCAADVEEESVIGVHAGAALAVAPEPGSLMCTGGKHDADRLASATGGAAIAVELKVVISVSAKMACNAAEIASSAQLDGTATRSYAEPLVENIQYELQAGASVKVLQTEDRMLGALLDVRA